MPVSTEAAPSAAELVARVKELHPLLKKNAAQGEQDRRVVEESIQALTDAGLFKVAVPKRYGGYETSMRTMLDVAAAAGAADGGTAWVLTLTNVCAWLASLFPEQAQDEVFGADPDAKVSGVLAPTAETQKVDGGWRVSGKWYYNSGSWHATWAVLGMPITDEAGEVVNQGLALIPRGDMDLEDTWFVAGMRSSGSNCLVAEDVFVPEHRVMLVPPAIGGEYPNEHTGTESFYRSAFVPILALVLVGPQLGMGTAALEYVISKAAKKPISYTFFTRRPIPWPSSCRSPRLPDSSTRRTCTPIGPPRTSTRPPAEAATPTT
ncbi:acyl-CoA dehydrogenase family protein [Modestobacter lapidis]